jgi:predicted GIY-YIG superfamily endonuclease
MEYLYTIECQSGKYYVGKSSDPDARYLQHKNGNGSAWTKVHRPVKLIEVRELKGEHDETNTTKDMMKKHGVDNVRGGSYTQVVLSDAIKSVLEMEIRGNTDKCFKCGLGGHFANQCSVTTRTKPVYSDEAESDSEEEYDEWACDYCDKRFSRLNLAQAHERRCQKEHVAAKKWAKSRTNACYRCGRSSHYSPDCYASTHVDGYELDD